MSDIAKSWDEVVERTGLAAKWETKGRVEVAKNLIRLGFPIETIVSSTNLDIDILKSLYQQ